MNLKNTSGTQMARFYNTRRSQWKLVIAHPFVNCQQYLLLLSTYFVRQWREFGGGTGNQSGEKISFLSQPPEVC